MLLYRGGRMTNATDTNDTESKGSSLDLFSQSGSDQPQSQIAVYVYQSPIRAWHWLNMFCIIVLCFSGYFIGSPPPSLSGEASSHYLMGYTRFAHFAAGQILTYLFLGRIFFAFTGNHYARELFILPVHAKEWRDGFIEQIKWYCFAAKQAPQFVGHNPVAQCIMFFGFVLPIIFMILSGLALYAEGLGMGHWLYNVMDFMLLFFDGSMSIHTYHHLGMWVIVCFVMVHLYAAFREELVSRQSMISTMISGWRMFK